VDERESESVEAVVTAINEASELQDRGEEGAALGRLRRAINENSSRFEVSMKREGTRLVTHIHPAWLILRAREAFLSLTLGQSSEGAHHGWLNLYEMASPVLPESNSELRFWMDRLRIVAALEHDAYLIAAAWAVDLEDLITGEEHPDTEARLESLGALANAASHLGFPRTAESFYQQALEVPSTPDNLARVKLTYGSFLFDSEEPERALGLYDEVIETLSHVESPTAGDFQELAKALRRRADCKFRAGEFASGLQDSERGLEHVDQAREKGRYSSVRSIDRAIATDVDQLLAGISRCPTEISSPDVALRMFLHAANSSVVAALRTDPELLRRALLQPESTSDAAPNTSSGVFLHDDRPGTLMQAKLARSWKRVDESTVERMMNTEPTLMIAATGHHDSQVVGFSLLIADGSLRLRPWRLDSSKEGLGQILTELMQPAQKFLEEGKASAWDLSPGSPSLIELAEKILPIGELSDVLMRGLRISALGAMWNFPFACLPVHGEPLGVAAPLVLSVPLVANTPAPSANQWAGHFDHSLEYALRDQQNAAWAAAANASPMRLVDRAENLRDESITLFMFSGHGTGLGLHQRLRLSSGEMTSAVDLGGTAHGASFVLNACWSGNVMDVTGTDPVDLPLLLLAQGAHSVWAGFGSINDRRAALASEALLREVRPDRTISQAAQHAFRSLLDDNPELPLREWATHGTIGRSTNYLVR
jgi:tetratricopeptide (TPR) repeat protein